MRKYSTYKLSSPAWVKDIAPTSDRPEPGPGRLEADGHQKTGSDAAEPQKNRRPRSASLKYILKLGLLLALLWYLFNSGKIDLHKIGSIIDLNNWPILVLPTFLFFLSLIALSIRQRLLVNYIGGNLSFLLSFQIFLVTTFFNNFLPGATGGDIARLFYLRRYTGIRYSELGGFVILDRILGVSGLAIIVYLDLIVLSFLDLKGISHIINGGHRLIWGLTLIPLALLASLLLLRINYFYGFLIKISQGLIFGQQIQSFLHGLNQYAHRRRLLLIALGVSAAAHFMAILGVSLLAFYVFGPSALTGSLLLSPLVVLTSILPVTPGNIGWTETMAETIWNLFGVQGGATTFVLWRIICVLVSLSGGLVYLRLGKIKNSETG